VLRGLSFSQAVTHRSLSTKARLVHLRTAVDKVELEQVSPLAHVPFQVLWFLPVNIIPPVLHTHLPLHVAHTRTEGPRLRIFQKQCSFKYRIVLDRKVKKVKLSRYRPEQALGGSGRLRFRIFSTFCTMKVVRSSPLRTGRLYPQEFPGTHF
jgi:hypothetical protein